MLRCFAVSAGAVHGNSIVSVVGVMRRLTTVVAMVARCRIDSVHVLTKDSALSSAWVSQYSSCFPWL